MEGLLTTNINILSSTAPVVMTEQKANGTGMHFDIMTSRRACIVFYCFSVVFCGDVSRNQWRHHGGGGVGRGKRGNCPKTCPRWIRLM